MNRTRVVAFSFLFLCAGSSVLGAGPSWKIPHQSLDKKVEFQNFNLRYTLNGSNSILKGSPEIQLQDQAQKYVESIGLQMERAHSFYADELGLVVPQSSKRYRGKIGPTAVHFLSENLSGNDGWTGDGVVSYRYVNAGFAKPSLTIGLSSDIAENSLTPSHEVFHTFQYGYTFYKNKWFLEGMARSMEYAFKTTMIPMAALPRTENQLEAWINKSYSASMQWNRLYYLCDPGCSESDVQSTRVVESYRPVKGAFCGKTVVRSTLEALSAADQSTAIKRGLNAKDWSEDEQYNKKNDVDMLKALANTVQAQCPVVGSHELETFVNLIKNK